MSSSAWWKRSRRTCPAWYDVIARGQEPTRIRVNVVRFAPGARLGL
jgi:hypothetical protein